MAVVYPNPTDSQTREAVLHQLGKDTAIDVNTIRVAVHDGVVTLTGFVDTNAGRLAAEREAESVPGVKAVTNHIEVRPLIDRRSDTGHQLPASQPVEPIDEQC